MRCAEEIVNGKPDVQKKGKKICANYENILIMLPKNYTAGTGREQ
jgi:hypothetical protein